MDVLDMFDEAIKEKSAFKNYSVNKLPLEEQILYLHGLALVMNAENEIDEEGKEDIRILIKSFEIDESLLEPIIEFVFKPDKELIQEIFRSFGRRPIALFLFDALMMTRMDNKTTDKLKKIVEKLSETLEV